MSKNIFSALLIFIAMMVSTVAFSGDQQDNHEGHDHSGHSHGDETADAGHDDHGHANAKNGWLRRRVQTSRRRIRRTHRCIDFLCHAWRS